MTVETTTLNVTFNGESQNLASVEPDTPDEDLKRIAAECLGLGEVFTHFVVDRFPETQMVFLRPKVPFG